jgi:hypothetical protein
MKRHTAFTLAFTLLTLAALAVACGCSKRRSAPAQPEETASYIGSEWCGYCHGSVMSSFETTGHPNILKRLSGGEPPSYPAVSPGLSGAGNPPNFLWTDVTYVVGGYGWKANFLGSTGYFITAGGENQYNLADSSWTNYRQGEQVSYDCARCHTTGYAAEGHQDGLEGISGTWELNGVQCERCHGPGNIHATDPDASGMTIDRSAGLCGECHSRGDVNLIPARSGFIRHYEQYNELLASEMADFDCIDCHDPHKRAHWSPDGIHTSCQSCHDDNQVLIPQMSAFECTECHMPYASLSAKSLTEYQADVRTHLFAINTDSLAQMFDSAGDYANGYLTIEYSCMYSTCHDGYTKGYLSSVARFVH